MVGEPPVTRTPYALEPAPVVGSVPVGVPELMVLFFNNGLPPATRTPVVWEPPGPLIVMFSIVPLTDAVTIPLIVVVPPPTPPVTVMPDARVKALNVPLCTSTLELPVPVARIWA